MPRCNRHGKLALAQVPNNASAEKPGSAENGDSASLHGLPGLTATNRRSLNCTADMVTLQPQMTAGSGIVHVTLWLPDEAHRRA
jgi:hypothetical protein